MPYRVRFRPRSTRIVLRHNTKTNIKVATTRTPSSTPNQRLFLAVRAIQRRYGPRILVWRTTKILPKTGANRPL